MNMSSARRAIILGLASWSLSAAEPAPNGPANTPPNPARRGRDGVTPLRRSDFYGFLSPEIYKLDSRTRNLLARDINGDGKIDLIVDNPLRNRIDVLEQRSSDDPIPEKPEPTDANELLSDSRLRHRKLPVPRSVASLEVRDVDHDGRADLVYLGDPPGLYVEYQDAEGRFGRLRHFDVPDAGQNTWMLDVADLNGDKRNDIAFLGKEHLYVVLQNAQGRLEEPKRYRLSEGGGSLLRILDYDHDGRNDITFLSEDKKFPVRIRFQSKSGALGAERRYAIEAPRGVAYVDFDNKPGEEMLIISETSDRLLVYTLAPAEREEAAPTSNLVVFPFEKTGSSSNNDLVTGDVTGDGRADVVVSDPDASRLLLFSQQSGEGLSAGQSFPTYLGTTALRAVDLDGDGKREVIALSDPENAIGLVRFDGQRLSFPQALPTKDDPIAMEVLGTPKDASLVYIARVQDADGRNDSYVLRRLKASVKDQAITWTATPIKDKTDLPTPFPARPNDLRAVDVNQDGIADLIAFIPFQPPVVLLGTKDGSFAPLERTSQGTLGAVTPAAVFSGPLLTKTPSFLVAQNNFARNLRLDAAGKWQVVDQSNISDAAGTVTGVTAIDLDQDGKPELALYDRASRQIVFLKAEKDLFRRWRQLDAGAFSLRGVRVADFDGDKRDDLLLFDANQMAIAYTGKSDPELKQIASYETDIRKGKLFDMTPGDLNNDGKLDILLLEPLQHHLEIVTSVGRDRLERVSRWKVFEEKTFRQSAPGVEPRECVIADVDGDGRNDIAVLVHDRVLVYLQDKGTTEKPKTPPAAN